MVHFFNGPISDEPTKYRGNKTIYFQFDFRIVPTVWYFVQFIAYDKKINESLPDETSWGMSSDVSVPLKKREIQQIYIILLD